MVIFTSGTKVVLFLLLQCYTHQTLGWKIEVVDEYPPIMDAGGRSLLPGLVSLLLAALITMLWL